MSQITTGTSIYYTGDMANASGFGIVSRVLSDKWGRFVDIAMHDGREKVRIPVSMIGNKYEGHCGTRFVTREAYEAWRSDRIAESRAKYGW